MPNTKPNTPVSVFNYIEFHVLFTVLVLCTIGLTMVASSSLPTGGIGNDWGFVKRQVVAIGIGAFAAFFIFTKLSLGWLEGNRGKLFVLTLVLLALVLIVGQSVNGAKRWIGFGGLNFQPAELAKLVVVIFMAGYLKRHADLVSTQLRGILRLFWPFGLMSLFLFLEPDFGSVAVSIAIIAGMLLVAGAPLRFFLVLVLPLAGILAFMVGISDYRMSRIFVFLDPWASQFGEGYQIVQAQIASGSGGWTGLGLGNSVQKMLYLPDAHTDFIFSVYAEELGFLGVVFLMGLYIWLISRIFYVGSLARAKGLVFGANLCYGVGLWIAIQMVINIGGNIGALPSKGLTLPFISYGGSSMIMYLVAIGLVLRVYYDASIAPMPEPAAQQGAETEAEKPSVKKTSQKPRSRTKPERKRKSA